MEKNRLGLLQFNHNFRGLIILAVKEILAFRPSYYRRLAFIYKLTLNPRVVCIGGDI